MEKQYVKDYVFLIAFLFFYALSIFVIHISNSQYIVSISNYEDSFDFIKSFLYILSFLCLVFFYKVNKYTAIDFVITLFFMISYFYSRITISVFIFFLFVKYLNFSTVIKAFLFAVLCGLLFVFFTYLFDLYSYSFVDMYRADGTFRSPLGYKYPTYLPNLSLYICLSWFYLRKNKISLIEILIVVVLNYLIYKYTDTRASYYLINLLILIVCFIKLFNIDYRSRIFGFFGAFFTVYTFLILSVITIYLQIIYNPDIHWMDEFNKILSGRLFYGHKAYVDYGISVLGQKINYISVLEVSNNNSLFVVDSGFMKVLLDYGIVLYSIITFGFIWAGKQIVKNNDIYLGAVLVISLVDIAVNPHLVQLDFNPFFFIIAYFGIFNKNLFK